MEGNFQKFVVGCVSTFLVFLLLTNAPVGQSFSTQNLIRVYTKNKPTCRSPHRVPLPVYRCSQTNVRSSTRLHSIRYPGARLPPKQSRLGNVFSSIFDGRDDRRNLSRGKKSVIAPICATHYLASTDNATHETLDVTAENDDKLIKNDKIQKDDSDDEDEEEQVTEEEVREKEEKFQAAVQEVQVAAKEVQESAGKLKDAIIQKAPQISSGFVFRLVSLAFWSDVRKRRKCYLSDWTDGFRNMPKVISAVLFLYFSCLAPAVSFGTIASELTNGSIGVVEFLLGSGLGGAAYAVLCGQPMAFIAPTGLTLAFISGLFRFCYLKGLPFLPVYSWVGLWTGLLMILLGTAGSSKLIKLCTHFTDEVFNALLSVTFIYEALHSLRRNFQLADPANLTMPFSALAMALATFASTMKVNAISTSRYFNDKIRAAFKDFGPVLIIIFMSLLNLHPAFKRIQVPMLTVPDSFQLAGGRQFVVPFNSISTKIKLLCFFPALLLTSLFFMDHNISVRLVNKKDNKLQKGDAYNLDMVAVGLVTGGLSMVGLPWMCGATVQSMNHVRAMTTSKFNETTQQVEIADVTETRLTGFVVHSMIAASIYLLRLLKFLPIPVVSGVFLFLGRKLMTGNSFLKRVTDSVAERSQLPADHPIHVLGRRKMNVFTSLQLGCLTGLWAFKQCAATSMFFPSVILVLMIIRARILPRFFTEEEFIALGDRTPVWR